MLRNHDLIRQLIREVLAEERGPVSQTVVIGPVGSTFRPVAAPGLGKIIIASAFAKAYGWLGDYTGEGCIMANPNYPCTRSQPLFEAYSGAASATGTTSTTPAPAGDFQLNTYITALDGDKADLIASYDAAKMAVTQWRIDNSKQAFSDLDTTVVRGEVVTSVSTMLSKTCLVSTSLDNNKIDDMILEKLNKRADFKAFLLKFVDSAHSDFISITNGHSSKFKMDTKLSSLPGNIKTVQTAETAAYNKAKAEIKKL